MYVRGFTPRWHSAEPWLGQLGLGDNSEGWRAYLDALVMLGTDEAEQARLGFKTMAHGWAIGTEAWRKAIAKEHAHKALSPGLTGAELREMKETRWEQALRVAVPKSGGTLAGIAEAPKTCAWKVRAALELRQIGAPCAWIAAALNMGTPGALRVKLCRAKANKCKRPPELSITHIFGTE